MSVAPPSKRHSPFFWLILFGYLIIALIYSVFTPLLEASDELWHYPTVKYIVDKGFTLPIQDPRNPGDWRQEGSQPPLYYILAALITGTIDTSDLSEVRYLNPHPDLGVVRPDGNLNAIVHDFGREGFPWRGASLAIMISRWFSVALGAVTVIHTYRIARSLFPAHERVALGAMILTTFNPMFLFISGSVNNDNLSNAVASVLLYQVIQLVQRDSLPPLPQLVGVGVMAGAGLLAKFNIGFLLPLIALSLTLISLRSRSWRPVVIGGALTGGLTILIGGWWYLRNLSLYGDPTGLNVFLQIVGQRAIPANLPQLWSERHTFLMSYWGLFGGVNLPLPDLFYSVFNGLALLGVVGIGIALARSQRRFSWAHLFAALWIIVLFVSLLRWTQTTWASQGRLMFAAIAPLSAYLAYGLYQWRRIPLLIAEFWFIFIALLCPILISQTYRNPEFAVGIPEGRSAAVVSHALFRDGDQTLELALCCDLPKMVKPGDYYTFDVAFRTEKWQPTSAEWSVFVHLVNSEGVIVAQRDVLLRQGTWSTRRQTVSAPTQWFNRFAIQLPDLAYTPDSLDLWIGFYERATGRRMSAQSTGEKIAIRENAVKLGAVRLEPRTPGVTPNATNVNFGDQIELVGYTVSDLSMQPKQSVTVTVYWRAKQKLRVDYSAFVHVVNPQTTEIYGGADGMPKPTSQLEIGEIIEDKHTFTINDSAPPGQWMVEVGLYEYANGEFKRLRVITPDGGQAENYLYLTRVRIGE
jgi:hypothetical protein